MSARSPSRPFFRCFVDAPITLVDLLTQPAELARARAEFEERTGGVGGSQWVAPLLPRDFMPPIDLRWPEYVTTPRGEEWWIPTPHPDLR